MLARGTVGLAVGVVGVRGGGVLGMGLLLVLVGLLLHYDLVGVHHHPVVHGLALRNGML